MRKFDPLNMTPSDCVELHEEMSDFISAHLAGIESVDDLSMIDRDLIISEAEESCGLSVDEIIRFSEIGEYILLDREDRGIPQQDLDKWRHKRDMLGVLIDSLILQAIEKGLVDKDTVVVDSTIEDLENLWDLS